jgi:hypothetical protein
MRRSARESYSVCYKKLQSPSGQPIVILSFYTPKHSVVSSSQSPPTTGFDRYFMRYAHTLLFDCPECNLPIAVSRICNEKNLEGVAGKPVRIKCSYCEHTSERFGWTAKAHWVSDWDLEVPVARDKQSQPISRECTDGT